MRKIIKHFLKKSFHLFGLEISEITAYKKLSEQQVKFHKLEFSFERLSFIASKCDVTQNKRFNIRNFFIQSVDKLVLSNSQLFQDLFILYYFNYKTNGFFVEFGATNGINLSNTYLLEKNYGWKGILAEPAKVWMTQLQKNRNCFIDDKCVWTNSGNRLIFDEVSNPEFSTISEYVDTDFNATTRNKKNTYEVQTISLIGLLKKYNAPLEIDYLSVDTEGSEFDILNAFDFSAYKIKIITVEHNYSEKRNLIHALLSGKGFKRVFEEISLFDDWYINE